MHFTERLEGHDPQTANFYELYSNCLITQLQRLAEFEKLNWQDIYNAAEMQHTQQVAAAAARFKEIAMQRLFGE